MATPDSLKNHHPAERTLPPEREKAVEYIDSIIREYAEILEIFDNVACEFSVDSNGRVKEPDRAIDFSGEKFKKTAIIRELIKQKQASLEQQTNAIKGQKGITDVQSTLGTQIIIYNSAVATPEAITALYSTQEISARGSFSPRGDTALGIIDVDINPKKREIDNLSPTVSLIHELHHYFRSLIDIAMANDSQMLSASSVLHEKHIALVEKKRGKTFSSNAERILQDRKIYEALLDQDIPTEFSKDTLALDRRIKLHRTYLDELHSSFLQKKVNWFSSSERLYTTQKKGTHAELIGENPKDKSSVANIVCYLQGIYAAEMMHAQMRTHQPAFREQLFKDIPQAEAFYTDFPQFFIQCGARIGASRVIQQAERFLREQWQELQKNNLVQQKLGLYINHIESQKNFAATTADGKTLSHFLKKK